MKNLKQLVQDVKDDLDALDIPYREVRYITINSRAKKQWGLCESHRDRGGEYFTIKINSVLLKDELDDMAAKNTIAHEFLHTIKDCMNHGATWKSYARKLDVFGYNVNRVTSAADKGITGEIMSIQYRYTITCSRCGNVGKYTKKTKALKMILAGAKNYSCARCGRQFTAKDILEL